MRENPQHESICSILSKLVAVLTTALWLGQAAQAMHLPVHEIRMHSADESHTDTVPLPHLIQQDHSGLLTVRWLVPLPPQLAQANLPALLVPQAVQGFRVRLRGQLVFELAPSNERMLRNWFAPALVALPKSMIDPQGNDVLEFEQTGHLRGWFIAPMLLGEFNALQPLFDSYAFISQTMEIAIMAVCGLWGVFLIVVGIQSNARLLFYGGLIAVLWSAMIGIAFMPRILAEYWYVWRMSLYFITGWLIYCEILFNCAIYQKQLKPLHNAVLLVCMNAGWVAFGLLGWPAETFLDEVWTGLVTLMYAGSVMWVIGIAIARKDWQRAVPIAVFLAISMALSWHDHSLYTGSLQIQLPDDAQALWSTLLSQPLYLIHLVLPAFIGMTLWLVGKDHIRITKNQWLHEHQLSQARERMVADIHDGVGSRINLLLWSLRTSAPPPARIAEELQYCMDELRFAIDPPSSGQHTLHNALETLVQRLSASAPPDLQIRYERSGPGTAEVSSEAGLQLYKATHECLSNALRHSGATQITVRLDQQETEIEVSVSDNGRGVPGWDNARQAQLERRSTSLGLVGLKTRMQHRNGRCHIESSAQGTNVRLSLPVSAGLSG